jgi:hypothetical protein
MDGRAWLTASRTAHMIPTNMGKDDKTTGAAKELVDDAAWQR